MRIWNYLGVRLQLPSTIAEWELLQGPGREAGKAARAMTSALQKVLRREARNVEGGGPLSFNRFQNLWMEQLDLLDLAYPDTGIRDTEPRENGLEVIRTFIDTRWGFA